MRGERHDAALLFWCKCSKRWENWGVCGGSCLRRNDGVGAGMTEEEHRGDGRGVQE